MQVEYCVITSVFRASPLMHVIYAYGDAPDEALEKAAIAKKALREMMKAG